MAKKFLSSVLIICLCCFPLIYVSADVIAENPDTSNWFAWSWPEDGAAYGSAIDASFMLDAPAGKHGFAHPNGENIVFDNGAVGRFWGTNIAMSASFVPKDQAEKLADRIARSGFNLVRFHQMDYGNTGNIFTNEGLTTTRELDPAQLDNLFYLISLLKERGVYLYIDLLVSRTALEKDGITDASDVSSGFKGHGIFDDTLVGLQKEYARKLLTTVNPYTGLSLANDPAMVFIDIQNENGLFFISGGTISSPYYLNELKSKFNQWLKNKYTTNEMLQSAWTQSGKVGLNTSESINNGTVDIIGDGTVDVPTLYDNLNYSAKRKTDSYEFFFDLTHDMYLDMKNYLHEIGVKCLITGSSMGGYSNAVPANTYLDKEILDFTDRHVYLSHPDNYFNVGSYFGNTSMVKNGNSFFTSAAYRRVYNQPFVLGEWQQCMANDFRAEGPLMMSAMASFQNWNPVQFNLLPEFIPDDKKIHGSFSTFTDPSQTTIQPAAAMLFHRHDVKEAEDAYYNTFSKADVLNSKTKYPTSSIYRYGKVGTMYSGFPDYDSSQSNTESFQKLEQKRVSGETQLNNEMNWSSQSFKVDSEYTNALAGFEPGVAYEFSNCSITYNNPFAVISLNSVTKENLANTDRMLLTTGARSRNTGFTLSDGAIATIGSEPVLVEPVSAKIIIKQATDIIVYALDSSGNRKAVVPVNKTSEGFNEFYTDGQYRSVYYEIVKKNPDLNMKAVVRPDGNVTVTGRGTGIENSVAQIKILNPGFTVDEKDKDGAVYLSGQATINEYGEFNFDFAFEKESIGGEYIALAEFDNIPLELSKCATTFSYISSVDGVTLNITPVNDGKFMRLSGHIIRKLDGIKNSNVTLAVLYPDYKDINLVDIPMDKIAEAVYLIRQTKADDEGNFSFDIAFGDNPLKGQYKAVISVEGIYAPEEKRSILFNNGYRITYDANGADFGSVPVDGNEYLEESTVLLPGNTGDLRKAGYKFKGWAVTADSVKTLGTCNIQNEDIKLYAVWEIIVPYWNELNYIGETPETLFGDEFLYDDGTTADILVSSGGWTGQISAKTDGAYTKVLNHQLVMQGRTTETGSLSMPEMRKNLPETVVSGGEVLTINCKIKTGSIGDTYISFYDNANTSYLIDKMLLLQNGEVKAYGGEKSAYIRGSAGAADSDGESVNICIVLDFGNKRYSIYAKGQPLAENMVLPNWNTANNLAIRLRGTYPTDTKARNWCIFDDFQIRRAGVGADETKIVEDGVKIKNLPRSGAADIIKTILNEKAVSFPVTLITAKYDSFGRLTGSECVSAVIAPLTSKTFEQEIEIKEEDYSLKTFLWNGFDNITPLILYNELSK